MRKFGTREMIGLLNFTECGNPPHYSVSSVFILSPERGKGFASQLLAEIEKVSRETGKPIVLRDGTSDAHGQNQKAVGLYDKREGWTRLRKSDGTVTKVCVYGTQDPIFFSEVLKLPENHS